jgi:alanyl-tRNA synthetase
MNAKVKEIDKLALKFKVQFNEVSDRVEKLQEENHNLLKQVEKLEEENARAKFATIASKAQDIDGGKLFISKVEKIKAVGVKLGVEFLSHRLGESIVILANENTVIAKVSESFVKKGIQAGKLVGEIARATGANGGGRPNFAQGGIKDFSKLDEILLKVEKDIKSV